MKLNKAIMVWSTIEFWRKGNS